MLVETDKYFVNPMRPTLFGAPVIVRVVPGLTTCKTLYSDVWHQIRPFFDAVPQGENAPEFPFVLRRVKSAVLGQLPEIWSALGERVSLTLTFRNANLASVTLTVKEAHGRLLEQDCMRERRHGCNRL